MSLQWVPAHVGIPGNEMADAAAREAAEGRGATPVDLSLSYSDINRRLTAAAWSGWRERFLAGRLDESNLDPSPPGRAGVPLPYLPAHLAKLLRRLRCGVWRTIYVTVPCECGGTVSPHHIIFNCPLYVNTFECLLQKMRLLKLSFKLSNLVCKHDRVGWQLAVEAAKCVYNCAAAPYI